MKRFRSALAMLLLVLMATPLARAHVGSKDVFETLQVGPYKLFVTIRMPNVIPGVATVEVEAAGDGLDKLEITPTPLTGEASLHPPAADAMVRDLGADGGGDAKHFTGSLWIMASGSWEVRFHATGSAGEGRGSVPVAAVPLSVLPMGRGLGWLLAALGVVLVLGFAGLVAAAVRESRLAPGLVASPEQRRRSHVAFGLGMALAVVAVALGGKWWHAEDRGYAAEVYRPETMQPTLQGDVLQLEIGSRDEKTGEWRPVKTGGLLLDHGKVMHLYAIRWPQMDAVFHLHPVVSGKGKLTDTLPKMLAGQYRLFADIVFPSGFPETLTASLTVPEGMPGGPLDIDDASAMPPALAAGALSTTYPLPDGNSMRWDAPSELVANRAYAFRFELLNAAGRPAGDVVPYLGMAGHAAFVKTDGSVFAHTHPEGSAAMPAMMMANGGADMAGMSASASSAIPAEVSFPYGFPAAGRYRIFVQMKHGAVVETGVFDAQVK